MAQPVLRRIPSNFPYLSRCPQHGRWFSKPACLAAAPAVGQTQPQPQSQKSMRVLMQEATEKGTHGSSIPSDMGLLPETLVMPSASKRPSLFRLPKERLKLEWLRIKRRCLDFGGLIYYKYFLAKKPNPRPKLGLRDIGQIASALHRQMYSAFAEGDVRTLEKICASGLLASFRSRIGSRPPEERLKWTLHNKSCRPRIVSNRAAPFPDVNESGLRQAVVRLQSNQSLLRLKSDKAITGELGPVKEIKEYVVVQKMMWYGKEGPWMVWGTVEESDWRTIVIKR